MAGVATLPAAGVALAFLAVGMGLLGMGNGSVFQLVPQRFPGAVGIMTGIVGAAGGLGGFLLPSLLGTLKDKTGSFGTGFARSDVASFAWSDYTDPFAKALVQDLAGGRGGARGSFAEDRKNSPRAMLPVSESRDRRGCHGCAPRTARTARCNAE